MRNIRRVKEIETEGWMWEREKLSPIHTQVQTKNISLYFLKIHQNRKMLVGCQLLFAFQEAINSKIYLYH